MKVIRIIFVIIVITFMAILIVGNYPLKNSLPTQNKQILLNKDAAKITSIFQFSEIKFTGIVQDVKNEQNSGNKLSLMVGGRWITISNGKIPPSNKDGSIEDINLADLKSNIGKKVEVYATQNTNRELSVLVDSKYYIRRFQ